MVKMFIHTWEKRQNNMKNRVLLLHTKSRENAAKLIIEILFWNISAIFWKIDGDLLAAISISI